MARKIPVKLILELRAAKLSMRKIAAIRRISRHSVSEVFRIANERDIAYQDVKDMGDEEQLLRERNFCLFDTRNFLYDFTPDSLSLIRDMAEPELARSLPFDRMGRSRLADDGPDAGCLEYIK